MNINSIRAEARSNKIEQILGTIKKALEEGLELKFEAFLNDICYKQRVARRTGREFLDIALSQVEHKIEGKGKEKIIYGNK